MRNWGCGDSGAVVCMIKEIIDLLLNIVVKRWLHLLILFVFFGPFTWHRTVTRAHITITIIVEPLTIDIIFFLDLRSLLRDWSSIINLKFNAPLCEAAWIHPFLMLRHEILLLTHPTILFLYHQTLPLQTRHVNNRVWT